MNFTERDEKGMKHLQDSFLRCLANHTQRASSSQWNRKAPYRIRPPLSRPAIQLSLYQFQTSLRVQSKSNASPIKLHSFIPRKYPVLINPMTAGAQTCDGSSNYMMLHTDVHKVSGHS